MKEGSISDSSRRIAKNTVLLYVRMLVMMVIGLVTYRIILRSLGVTDYGVYSAVGGVVTLFMLVMNTVSSAISRYITVGLGEGDLGRLKAVFSTSLAVMGGFCLVILLLTETLGLWYLQAKMQIPPGRMDAARVVLHTSALVLVVNLMSLPYTAAINAHEHMSAYAWISILEAFLKLAVALGVWLAAGDKLVVYAWLLFVVAVLSRLAYVGYAHRHFPETYDLPWPKKALMKEMGAFAGWNFLGSGAYMLNTQGVNQLMNLFFGVGANAARGVADKVEQVVRQFATNIALALNPPLTKAYAAGDKHYAFALVCKGSKFYFWAILVIALPFITDAETILRLWIGGDGLPPQAALFTRLTLVCFLVDFTPSTLNVLEQAQGHIKRYYLITSAVAAFAFFITWGLYSVGFQPFWGYRVFILVYLVKGFVMLRVVNRDTGLPVKQYWQEAIVPMLAAALPAGAVAGLLYALLPQVWWRFLVVAAAGVIAAAGGIWLGGLTPGEKTYIQSKLHNGRNG